MIIYLNNYINCTIDYTSMYMVITYISYIHYYKVSTHGRAVTHGRDIIHIRAHTVIMI